MRKFRISLNFRQLRSSRKGERQFVRGSHSVTIQQIVQGKYVVGRIQQFPKLDCLLEAQKSSISFDSERDFMKVVEAIGIQQDAFPVHIVQTLSYVDELTEAKGKSASFKIKKKVSN